MREMLRRWTISLSLIASSTVTPGSTPTEDEVRAFIEQSYGIVVVYRNDQGGIVVDPVRYGLPSIEHLACTPEAPVVAVAFAAGAAETCLTAEAPSDSPAAVTRRAADEVRAWMERLPAEKLQGAVKGGPSREVVVEAEARYRATLERMGFSARLLDSWRRNVGAGAECVRALKTDMDNRLAQIASSIRCDRLAWDRVLELCSSPSRSVLGHIVVRGNGVLPVPERQLDAIHQLMGRGLLLCLADIIEEHGTEDLVESVKKLDLATGQLEDERLDHEAWALWSRHGVEEWLESTLARGSVPESVASALARCSKVAQVAVGQPAPRLDLRTAGGEPWSLGERPGRFLVVSFWASWCAPCRSEMRELARTTREWNGLRVDSRHRLEYVAVNLAERPEDVRPVLDNADYRSVVFGFDPDGSSASAWGVRGLPATFLVDPEGRILDTVLGYDESLPDRLAAKLRSIIADEGKPASGS